MNTLIRITDARYILNGFEIAEDEEIEIYRERRWVRVRLLLALGVMYAVQPQTGRGYHLFDGLFARRLKGRRVCRRKPASRRR